MFKTSLN